MTEPINVILLTYERTEYAVRTAKALIENLRYPELAFYIADDGSRQEHVDAVLKCFEGQRVSGWHTLPNGTYGTNANKAYDAVKHLSNLFMFIEDDWELRTPLDLYSYAALLMERGDISMVRLGYLNLGMKASLFGHGGKLYWRLERDADPYVYTGHPSLRHSRFVDSYGMMPEGLQPGYTELAYAMQFRSKGTGPDIVYPVESGEYGQFHHIGEIQSYQNNTEGSKILR